MVLTFPFSWRRRLAQDGEEFLAVQGNTCTGTVKVFVPHDMKKPVRALDGGPLYDSTQP